MLDYALEYHARGWSVVPCPQKRKVPYVKWSEYQTRKPSEEEIREWWRKWPDANIAMVTGEQSGVVVVDIDEREGASIDGHTPTFCMVETPGGCHLYYEHPGRRVQNSADKGTDVRGDGGIVMLPPSVHKSGKRYGWLMRGEPSAFPAWIDERKPEHKAEANGQLDIEDIDLDSVSDQPDWIERAFREGAPTGERNHTLAKLAGYFAGIDQDEGISLAMLHSWSSGLHSPLGYEEVERTVRSVYATERRRNPKPLSQATNTPAQAKAAKPEKGKEKPDPFKLIRFGAFMEKHLGTADDWDIEGWLPASTVAFLVAPPGSWKTWLEFDIALTLATGKPFFDGTIPTRTGPVILAQQEDKAGDIASRLAGIQGAKEPLAKPRDCGNGLLAIELPGDPPIYLHEEMRLHLGNAEVMGRLQEQIKSLGAIAVIGDPLYSMVPTEDHMAAAPRLMLWPKQIRNETGCSFIFAHHTTKGGRGRRGRERMHGSGLLAGAGEAFMQIHRLGPEGSTQIVVEPHTKSGSAMKLKFVDFEIDLEKELYSPKARDITSDTITALLQADELGDITRAQVEEILLRDGSPAPPKKRTRKSISKRGQAMIEALLMQGPLTAAELQDAIQANVHEFRGSLAALLELGEVYLQGKSGPEQKIALSMKADMFAS